MHRLLEEKLPIAEVARRVGRSRQTIYNWLRQEEDELTPAPRPSKLDPHRGYIESRLERYDLPATVLLEEIRARGYTGGITILRDLVATIKQRHVRRVVDRFETEPGRQAQMDWASCRTIWHQGRRRRSLHGLLMGLLFSLPLAFSGLMAPENPDFGKGAMLASTIVMGMIYGLLTEVVTSAVFKARATA
jgi:transposase